MITIDEPGWVINNTFDDEGRVVRQVTQLSGSTHPITYQFAYTVSNGSVVQTDMMRNGVRTRYTYNSGHYRTSNAIDADGPNPISVLYDRSADTNLIRGIDRALHRPKRNTSFEPWPPDQEPKTPRPAT